MEHNAPEAETAWADRQTDRAWTQLCAIADQQFFWWIVVWIPLIAVGDLLGSPVSPLRSQGLRNLAYVGMTLVSMIGTYKTTEAIYGAFRAWNRCAREAAAKHRAEVRTLLDAYEQMQRNTPKEQHPS